jgi:hypothetical protein
MNRISRLLLVAATILLTLACLGTPKSIKTPTSINTTLPLVNPTMTSTETIMPSPFPGLNVAFILNGNVWLWDGITPARQLTSNGDASDVKLSDDGKVIVFQRGQSLWAVTEDGTSPYLIVNLPIYSPVNPSYERLFFSQFEFQFNSHWIYFSTTRSNGTNNDDLYRVNADTTALPQALIDKDGGTITFSPDGNLLALSSLNGISVIHADGSELITALHYPTISLESGYIPQVVWMENGTGFYTVLPDNIGINSKYLFISADGKINAQLADLESDLGTPPIISPNGLKVAYVKQTATADELHLMEASNADSIIASYEGAPMLFLWNWSPDSQRVDFSNAHPILLLTAGIGIPPSPLTESVTPYSLRWVSDDQFIFFREGDLLIGQINNPETILIASGFSNQVDTRYYDFAINTTP